MCNWQFCQICHGTIVHHNHAKPSNCLSIGITSNLMFVYSLTYPKFDHDPPPHTMKNAIKYIVLWSFKLMGC